MNYHEAVNWLYSQLPMFQRIGAAAYKNDLSNTLALCSYFKQPQQAFPSIHVAGTNGKGSTSHMLASVLQASGYKVGLYTSPHLVSFTERIKVNGAEVDPDFVTRFVQENKDYFTELSPSFFEMTVAMAFVYFKEQKVDIAVIETGLGGRLDSTNIITPELSIITNIGWDHMALLGNTLPAIAAEKAGIIKYKIPVIIGERQPEVEEVFINKARHEQSPLVFASDVWSFSSSTILPPTQTMPPRQELAYIYNNDRVTVITDQLGVYQKNNVANVLQACHQLQQLGWHKVNTTTIADGLLHVTAYTGLKGRWQVLGEQPTIVADVGHNTPGLGYVLEQISQYSFQQLFMVIGVVNDKDIQGMLTMLPKHATYIFTQANIPRAMPADDLYELAAKAGLQGEVQANPVNALRRAKELAQSNDFIFVGGSTFVVADVLAAL